MNIKNLSLSPSLSLSNTHTSLFYYPLSLTHTHTHTHTHTPLSVVHTMIFSECCFRNVTSSQGNETPLLPGCFSSAFTFRYSDITGGAYFYVFAFQLVLHSDLRYKTSSRKPVFKAFFSRCSLREHSEVCFFLYFLLQMLVSLFVLGGWRAFQFVLPSFNEGCF